MRARVRLTFERLRGTPYQLDFCLPPGSDRLFVHVQVVNPHDREVGLYWWSNIAVPPEVRVIAPATESWRYDYQEKLALIPAPAHDGADYSYPARAPHAADYFFKLAADQRPWIAAVDAAGDGLLQESTMLLRGRKLFTWGDTVGGRHWQDWLGGPYAEIQAGLAPTQLDHAPMPAGATWRWVEAYGPVRAAVGGGWAEAREAVEHRLSSFVLDTRLDDWSAWVTQPAAEVLHDGGPDESWPVPDEHYAHGLDLAHAGATEAAIRALEASVALAPTPWALRALAHLTSSPEHYLAAAALAPDCWQLLAEAGDALLAAGRPDDALALADSARVRHGRLDLLELRAALASGDRARAAAVFARGLVVPNLREGEAALDELWAQVHPDLPLPPEYDFRMAP